MKMLVKNNVEFTKVNSEEKTDHIEIRYHQVGTNNTDIANSLNIKTISEGPSFHVQIEKVA